MKKRTTSQPPKQRSVELATRDTAEKHRELVTKEYELGQSRTRLKSELSAAVRGLDKTVGLLESDKHNLAKRLSAALGEVDRLNQDKMKIGHMLQEERQHSLELERKLKHSGRLKHVVDRNMQGDLKFERDEGQRLQNVLHTLDVERAELRSKYKDFESASIRLQNESIDIGSRLTACTEHLVASEHEQRSLHDQLRSLQAQAAEYESEHSKLLQERATLKERLAEIEGQRSSALLRAEEESIRLQNYSVAMRNDKEILALVHRRHSRLLAARSLALRVAQAAKTRCRVAFEDILEYIDISVNSAKALKRLAWVMDKYTGRRSKKALDTWRSILNWTAAAKSRDALLEATVILKAKTKAYGTWRSLFIKRTHNRISKDLGLRTLRRRVMIDDTHSKRRALVSWRNVCNFSTVQSHKGFEVAKRLYKRLLQRGLYAWWATTKELTTAKARQDLAGEFAENLYKQAIFYEIRQATARQKAQKERATFNSTQTDAAFLVKVLNAWANCTTLEQRRSRVLTRVRARLQRNLQGQALGVWKKCLTGAKAVKHANLLIAKLAGKETEQMHEVCFAAWRSFVVGNKASVVHQTLVQETTKRQGLQGHYEELATTTSTEAQRVALRAFKKVVLRTQDVYFGRWVKACGSHNSGLQRCKTMVLLSYQGKIERAFKLWQQSKLHGDVEALQQRTEEMAAENEALIEHVNNLEAVLALRHDEKDSYAANCTHRCMMHLARFSSRNALRKWASHALEASTKTGGTELLEAKLTKAVLSRAFRDLSRGATYICKLENRKARLQSQVLSKWRDSMATTFAAWQDATTISKLANNALSKLLKRKRSGLLHQSLSAIGENAKVSRTKQAAQAQRTLADAHKTLSQEIGQTEASLQAVSTSNTKAERTMKDRATKRLWTAYRRRADTLTSRGLAHWKAFAELKAKQERIPSRLLAIWGKQHKRSAMRIWQADVVQHLRAEQAERVTVIIEETTLVRKEMKALKGGRRDELHAKQQQLRALELEHTVQSGRLDSLLDRNVATSSMVFEVSKAHWCLRGWIKHYRTQKTLLLRVKTLTLAVIYRRAFRAIKDQAKESTAESHLVSTLQLNFDHFGRRKLQCGLNLLRSRGVQKQAAECLAEAEATKTDNSGMQQLFYAVQKRTCTQGANQFARRQQGKLLQGWHKAASQRATLRRISDKFQAQLQTAAKLKALDKLKQRSAVQVQQERNTRNATGTYLKNLLGKAFRDWKYHHRVISYVNDVFVPLGRKHSHQCLQRGFAALQSYTVTKNTDTEWTEGARSNAILRIGKRLQLNQKAKALRNWKACKAAKAESQQHKRALFAKAVTRSLREAWDLWKELKVFKTIIIEESLSGHAADERSQLEHREQILLDIAQHEGIDAGKVMQALEAAERKQQGQLLNAVTRLRYLAGMVNDEDSTLKPRCFSTWKDWAQRRKACKAATVRLMGYARFPAAKQAFNRWKNGLKQIEKRYQSLPKAQLAGQIATMDREIRSLEAAVEAQDIKAKYLDNYCEILQSHTKRGLKQALSQCHSRVTLGKRQAYSVWALYVSLWKARELHLNIEDIEEQIDIVSVKKRHVEDDNEALCHENEELRQASLDGIAIADAIETLSKERERLSVDLADRASTIKQLIDENNALAVKLKTASIPERDVPRRYAVHHPS